MTTFISFNAPWYLSNNPDVAEAASRGLIDAFAHYERYGKAEGRSANPLFDPSAYLASNPDVAAAVARGETTAHDHFELFGASEGRSPLQLFDEAFYLSQNPDVAAAVNAGATTAIQHLLLFGQSEPRPFNPSIDLGAYLQENPDVAQAVAAGDMSALDHLIMYGAWEARALGNGIDLADFANDPIFQNAVASSDFGAALTRVNDVAPFIPSFQRPAGWNVSESAPVPVDFVPVKGKYLTMPEGFTLPEGVNLPDFFYPPTSRPVQPPSSDDDVTPPSFTVIESAPGSKAWIISTGNGNVVVTDDGINYIFTPSFGTAVSKAKTDVVEVVVNTITLSGQASVLKTLEKITGSVTVSDQGDSDDLTATDLSAIGNATTGVVTVSNAVSIIGTAAEVTAALVTDGTKVIAGAAMVTLDDASTATLAATMLSAIGGATTGEVVVNNGVTIIGTSAEVTAALVDAETKVTAGFANVTVLGAVTSSALADIHSVTSGEITVQGTEASETWDFSGFTAGGLVIKGLGGDDVIKGGSGADTITGGAGFDDMTGGAGADTFVFAAGDSGVISGTVFDIIRDYTAGVGGDALDLVGEAQAQTDAIGTDVAGAIATPDGGEVVTATINSGVITLAGVNASDIDTLDEWLAVARLMVTDDTKVGAFEFDRDTYVYQENIGGDLLIKLSGVTGILAVGGTAAENAIVVA